MRKVFVRTQNVKNFIAMMDTLQNRPEGTPGMGLVYGEPGLGKTQTILWWVVKNDAAYIRATNKMTNRWFLEEIVSELGLNPYYHSGDLFNQCVSSLITDPKIIIVDEIDYLAGDNQVIETLRDIHDKTNVPVILVGMGSANNKLKRYRHLYDRISEILRFESFTHNDIETILSQLCEIELTDCAIQVIMNKLNRFRQIVRLISRAEYLAQTNGLEKLDDEILQEVLKYDDRENIEDR